MIGQLRNGTYLREPDGANLLYFSPYSFTDPAENFRNRHLHDDGWRVVQGEEQLRLWDLVKLSPGEYVFIRGGRVSVTPEEAPKKREELLQFLTWLWPHLTDEREADPDEAEFYVREYMERKQT